MPVPIEKNPANYYDIVVLGAGFSGVKALYEARKKGYSIHGYEGGPDLGGTWRNNRYPGARVDSYVPTYELNIPEVYESWDWTVKYPDWKEIRKYFEHVENVLHVKKDYTFNTFIQQVSFDKNTGLWTLISKEGRVKTQCRFFLPCIGFASRNYKPDIKNFEQFQGRVVHSSEWPELDDSDYPHFDGKKVGIIGTGSTGVQIIQEAGPVSEKLYVYQRTPNLALPMNQGPPERYPKSQYEQLLKKRYVSPGGFLYEPCKYDTFEVSPEEREKFYQSMFDEGGFHFWAANYKDYLFDEKANKEAYNFWRKTVQKRIKDPKVAEELAPAEYPHPFGTKRPSLEQNYFEQYNNPNVVLVNVKKNPIKEFYEKGLILEDGTKQELDILVLATGFDALTGSFKNIDFINSNNGMLLKDEWEDGCSTYLGMSIHGYPNMFFTYGPQSPTAFSNGPSCVEMQLNFIFEVIDYMFQNNIKYIEADKKGQESYRKQIDDYTKTTLYPLANSWYMGANIPGKKIQMLNWPAGVPSYYRLLQEVSKKRYEGYQFVA